MKIAIATANGDQVSHFGQAEIFFIYDLKEEDFKVSFLEKRKTNIDPSLQHQWNIVLNIIKDCDVVLCSQVGMNAKYGVENAGIKVIIDKGNQKEVLERYQKHLEFMNKPLFK